MEQNHWTLDKDVVLNAQVTFVKDLKTCTVEELMQKLNQLLGDLPLWNQGTDCRVLEPGKVWQQGKVRLTIEFYPDEPQPV